jgi:hypothetical protein
MKTRMSKFLIIIFFLSSGMNLPLTGQNVTDQPEKDLSSINNPSDPPCFHLIPSLTNEQKDQMKTLHLQFMKEILPLQTLLKEKEARLTTLECAEEPDIMAIHKQIQETGLIRIEIAQHEATNHQEVRKILTEEQRIMFDSRYIRKGDHPKKPAKNRSDSSGLKHKKQEKMKKNKRSRM